MGSAVCAFGQSTAYHPVKIVDEFTARPDGGGDFGFNGAFLNTPSIDGGTLIFRTGDFATIWRANVDGTGLMKLVDAKEAVPGGTGTFTGLTTSNIGGLPRIKGGTVLFPGTSEDASMHGVIGLYTVPATGGALTRVVDTTMPVPDGDGTDFTSLGDYNAPTGSFTLSDGKVAFEARGGGTAGVYIAGINGGGLAALADGNHPIDPGADFPVENFYTPATVNGVTVFHGTNVFDPSNGNSGLYATSGGFQYRIVANYASALPGNTDASPHTRFDVPPLASNGTTLAFVADDSDSTPDFGGVFTVPVAGGDLTKVFDSLETLPGLDGTNGFTYSGLTIDGNLVVFAANDNPSNGPMSDGVFIRKADGTGPIVRLIGSGDVLDDGRVIAAVSMTTGGFSGGIVGVQVYYAYGYADGGYSGLYAVTPGAVAPQIVGASSASGTTTTPFSFRVLGTNFPTSYGVQGLPGGLSVNPTTGLISGTPKFAGSYQLTLNAYDSAGKGSGTLTLTVTPGTPVISSASMAAGTTGVAFSYQIVANGNPTAYGVQGLPGGLTVNASTGLISGTPKVAGTYNLTLNAYNNAGKGSAPLTLTVALGPPVITSATMVSGQLGAAFSYHIVASGSPTSYGVQGLPGGLTVNAGTGLISGTPKVTGTFTLTLNAYNSAGKGSATLTLFVGAQGAPVVSSPGTAPGKVGTGFSYQITASGSPTTYGVQGLPARLTLNAASGLITGTPDEAGGFTVTLRAYNNAGVGLGNLTLTITS